MFLPIFIAILLGLVSPANTNTNNCNGNTTLSTYDSGTNGDEDPDDDTPPSDGTGGETGQNPPR